MAGFWDLSDGGEIAVNSGSFEVGGGDLDPIPANTTAVAIIDEAKWDNDRDGNRHISLRWSVVMPAEYKNRKVFHRLWVEDDKPNAKDPAKKRDKDKQMLAAIDQNAGGKLMSSNKKPSDELLQAHLINKPMQIKIMTWEAEKQDGTMGRGNWIAAVAPRAGGAATLKAAASPKVMADEDAPF